jgi:hypothetical protein
MARVTSQERARRGNSLPLSLSLSLPPPPPPPLSLSGEGEAWGSPGQTLVLSYSGCGLTVRVSPTGSGGGGGGTVNVPLPEGSGEVFVGVQFVSRGDQVTLVEEVLFSISPVCARARGVGFCLRACSFGRRAGFLLALPAWGCSPLRPFAPHFHLALGQRLCGHGDQGGEDEEEEVDEKEGMEGLDGKLLLSSPPPSKPPASRWTSVAAAFGDDRPKLEEERGEQEKVADSDAVREEDEEAGEEGVIGQKNEQRQEEEEPLQGGCKSACDGAAALAGNAEDCSSDTDTAEEIVDEVTMNGGA